jgi:hypothetical protein
MIFASRALRARPKTKSTLFFLVLAPRHQFFAAEAGVGAQQQRAAVARDLAARETGLHAARKMCFKCERFLHYGCPVEVMLLSRNRYKTSTLWAYFACRDLKCMPASCLIAHDEGMNEGKSIFSQLIDFLPDREFRRCVARYGGDRYTKKLSCWEQFLAMAFAQRAYRESLRGIEACLGAIGPKLYHMGFGSVVARSIVRKCLGIEASLYQLLQIFSVTLFEKTPILRALQRYDSQVELERSSNRLILFDF